MTLTPEQRERFLRVWFPLLRYVNEEKHVIPAKAWPEGGVLEKMAGVELRDALWADASLLERYLSLNPAGLAPEDLALAESWRHRRFGDFWVARYLKQYTVFLEEDATGHLYGVLGLSGPIERMLGPAVPRMVRTTLLPVDDRITYDGLMSGPDVLVGPGIRDVINERYRGIEEREGIITSLPPQPGRGPVQAPQTVPARNEEILAEFRETLRETGLSTSAVERHAGVVSAIAERLEQQQPPRALDALRPEDVTAHLQKTGIGTKAAKESVTSLRRFVRFLDETGQMAPNDAMVLSEFLRGPG